MQIMKKLAVVCGGFGLLAATLSGCASVAAVAGEEKSTSAAYSPSKSQIEALADGRVDRAEYFAGFASYQACMSENGYKVIVLDSKSTIIDMRIPEAAVESGTDNKCYQTEFMGINEAWQIANQDQLADSALLDACLANHGLAVPKTRQQKVDALLSAQIDLGTCLSQ